MLEVLDGNGAEVTDENEFKIEPKYRNRPMAYLRLTKPIVHNSVLY